MKKQKQEEPRNRGHTEKHRGKIERSHRTNETEVEKFFFQPSHLHISSSSSVSQQPQTTKKKKTRTTQTENQSKKPKPNFKRRRSQPLLRWLQFQSQCFFIAREGENKKKTIGAYKRRSKGEE